MVDKDIRDIADAAQNAAASVQQGGDAAKDYTSRRVDAAREYAGAARQYANKGYDAARDYANHGYDAAREYANAGIDVAGRMSENLTAFVRNEPWVAMAAAFAVGYLAARVLRRLSI
jgi:ElaB/YqjD/DUF883 family membrane-anchored ribosome-binding protein